MIWKEEKLIQLWYIALAQAQDAWQLKIIGRTREKKAENSPKKSFSFFFLSSLLGIPTAFK